MEEDYNPLWEELSSIKEKLEILENLSPQERFYFQIYKHQKTHQRNSINYFDGHLFVLFCFSDLRNDFFALNSLGLFKKMDWHLNRLPMKSISWYRVESAVEEIFPVSSLETFQANGTQFNYLSPISICRRWYASGKSEILTGTNFSFFFCSLN